MENKTWIRMFALAVVVGVSVEAEWQGTAVPLFAVVMALAAGIGLVLAGRLCAGGPWPGRARAVCAVGLLVGLVVLLQDVRRPAPGAEPAAAAWLVRECRGRVESIAVRGERARLIVVVDEALFIDGCRRPLEGRIAVFAARTNVGGIVAHARVAVAADLEPLPAPGVGTFGFFWKYLAECGVSGIVRKVQSVRVCDEPPAWRTALAGFRNWLDGWFAPLSPRERDLMKALVFGDRGGLSPEMRADFADAGVIHLLAVSGMHIAVIAAVFFGLARLAGVSRRLVLPALLVFLPVYGGLCGFTPSVMRAVVSVSFVSVACLWRAAIDPLDSLAAAAAILVLLDPATLGNAGFLLSFAATAGIIVGTGPLTFLGHDVLRLPRRLAAGLALSVAAQLFVVPILAGYFGRVSLVAPLANVVFVPAILGIQAVGMALPLLDWVPGATVAIGWFADLVGLTYAAISWTGNLPVAALDIGPFAPLGVVGYYLVLTALLKGLENVRIRRDAHRRALVAAQIASLLARARNDRETRPRPEFSRQPANSRTDCRTGGHHSRRESA